MMRTLYRVALTSLALFWVVENAPAAPPAVSERIFRGIVSITEGHSSSDIELKLLHLFVDPARELTAEDRVFLARLRPSNHHLHPIDGYKRDHLYRKKDGTLLLLEDCGDRKSFTLYHVVAYKEAVYKQTDKIGCYTLAEGD